MDNVLATLITGLVAGLGVGSVFTAGAQHLLKRKEATQDSQRKDLEARYRVIVLLMYAAYDFSGNETSLRINRPDLKSKQDVLGDLKAEWHNMTLFASQQTLDALGAFIGNPSKDNFMRTSLAMRVDLGRGRLVLAEKSL